MIRTRIAAALGVLAFALAAGFVAARLAPWNPSDVITGAADGPASAVIDDDPYNREAMPSVDPRVEFPAVLSGLPDIPEHLAVDPATGDLWFVIFSYAGDNTLYRYRAEDGKLETRPIPASSGSLQFSDIAVDSGGRVISAEGATVLVIEPEGAYKEFLLAVPVNAVEQPEGPHAYIIDMELSDDGKAYLTRMGVSAITELDLETGETREIPIPANLGQVHYIALAGDDLWMTAPYSTEQTTPQTAVLNVRTGAVRETDVRSVDLVSGKNAGPVAVGPETPGILRLASDPPTAVAPSIATDTPDSVREVLLEPGVAALDDVRGVVWMASVGRRGIVGVDIGDGSVRHFELPSWEGGTWISVPAMCQYRECDPPGAGWTRVGDLAVAPNGDVYFSDQTFNRIGVVNPH